MTWLKHIYPLALYGLKGSDNLSNNFQPRQSHIIFLPQLQYHINMFLTNIPQRNNSWKYISLHRSLNNFITDKKLKKQNLFNSKFIKYTVRMHILNILHKQDSLFNSTKSTKPRKIHKIQVFNSNNLQLSCCDTCTTNMANLIKNYNQKITNEFSMRLKVHCRNTLKEPLPPWWKIPPK